MAVQELGKRVQHDVGAQVKRSLQIRAAKRIVNTYRNVMLVCYLADGGDV